MNLATLPDDELLLVLGFLENRELLRCRGVCRRLRDAALHPHLWRKRSLTPSYDGVQLSAAVLRLVPCLGTLALSSQFHDYLKLGTLLAATNCAISELIGVLYSETGCVFVSMALSRQATLGRLSSVNLNFGTMSLNKRELQLLLHEVLHTPGLTSVSVVTVPRDRLPLELALPKAATSDAIPASLRRLDYNLHDATMLPFYLKWHADTLQVVNLGYCDVPAGTATLLGSLSQLKELNCNIMDNMEALLQCPGLKTLFLSVPADDWTEEFLPGAEQYLRQAVADRLENLTLQFNEEEVVDPDYTASFDSAVDLVQCLAGPSSSAPSMLRSLNLAYFVTHNQAEQPQPQLEPLADVLYRLDNLVTLDLGGPPTPDFLAALDGRVLPRLERLRFYLNDDTWGGGCPHEWAHGPEPRDLLRKYPRLHLDLHPEHIPGCDECDDDGNGCKECKCAYCAENTCHDFHCMERTLFSHPEHEVCNQKHYAFFGNPSMRIDL